MELITILLQIAISIGIFNVWLLRSGRPTRYRGTDATSLQLEFVAYGLPIWSFYLIGTLKLTAATLLLVGLGFPALIQPAAILIAVLMLGAVLMHAKVRDRAIQYLPASIMLIMSLLLLI